MDHADRAIQIGLRGADRQCERGIDRIRLLGNGEERVRRDRQFAHAIGKRIDPCRVDPQDGGRCLRRRGRRGRRHGMQGDLIWQQPEDRAQLVDRCAAQSLDHDHAGEGIDCRDIGPLAAGRQNGERGERRYGRRQRDRIVAAEEGIAVGRVAECDQRSLGPRQRLALAGDQIGGPDRCRIVGDAIFGRRRRIRAALEQAGRDPIRIRADRARSLHLVDPAIDLVEACDQARYPIGRQASRRLAGAFEHGLGGMEHALGGPHVEDPDRSLERVDRAERVVDRARIGGIGEQGGQIGLRPDHQVAAFDQELLEQLVHQGLR